MRTLILSKSDGVHFGFWQAGRTIRLKAVNLHWLPSSSPSLAGLTVVNNRTIPLFDVTACLGLSPISRDHEQYQVLLMNNEDSVGGFLLPRDIQLGRVSNKTLRSLPDTIRTPLQSAWLPLADGPVVIIETERLLKALQDGKTTPYEPEFSIGNSETVKTDNYRRWCTIITGGFEFALAGDDLGFRPAANQSVHPVAAAPEFFSGISVVAGHLLPVIRLAAMLELGDSAPVESLLLKRICGAYFGFEIDGKRRGNGNGSWTVKPLPKILRTSWMKAAAKNGDRVLPILELSSLLATANRSRYPEIELDPDETVANDNFALTYRNQKVEVLEFDIYGQRHALPKMDVGSIQNYEKYWHIPARNPAIFGMALGNDEIVPVVDLAAIYGVRSQPRPGWKMISLDYGQGIAHVMAEHIAGTRVLDPKEQHELPYEDDKGLVYGCYPADGSVRLILNIRVLMTRFDAVSPSEWQKLFNALQKPPSIHSTDGAVSKNPDQTEDRRENSPDVEKTKPVSQPEEPIEEPKGLLPVLEQQDSPEPETAGYLPIPEETAAIGPVLKGRSVSLSAAAAWLDELHPFSVFTTVGYRFNWTDAVEPFPALPVPVFDCPEPVGESPADHPSEERLLTIAPVESKHPATASGNVDQQVDLKHNDSIQDSGTFSPDTQADQQSITGVDRDRPPSGVPHKTEESDAIQMPGRSDSIKPGISDDSVADLKVEKEILEPTDSAVIAISEIMSSAVEPRQTLSSENEKPEQSRTPVDDPTEADTQVPPARRPVSRLLITLFLVACLLGMLQFMQEPDSWIFLHKNTTSQMPVTVRRPVPKRAPTPKAEISEAFSNGTIESLKNTEIDDKNALMNSATAPTSPEKSHNPIILKVSPTVSTTADTARGLKEKSEKQQVSKIDLSALSDREIVEAINGGAEKPDLVIVVEQAPNNSREPSAPATSPLSSNNIIVHKVKKGDTLWDISERYTGTGFSYPGVAEENKIHNPHRIYPDQKIWIIKKR